MPPSLTDTLCTRCGLCCDGSLFADVELAPDDAVLVLESLGLEIEDDDDRDGAELLIQPCAALRGTRCRVYSQRPECCRTFECRLLRDVRLGHLEPAAAHTRIAEALARIKTLRTQLRQLGPLEAGLSWRDQCTDLLAATEESTDAAVQRQRTETARSAKALEAWLRTTFLGAKKAPIGNRTTQMPPRFNADHRDDSPTHRRA